MDNPDPDALDVVADLVSEEQWLGSQAARDATTAAPAEDAHREDRLQNVEQELDRCSDLLLPRRDGRTVGGTDGRG
ncbi:DUF2630 family protein [Arthrobacter halodurans]|uniref:DUF2630 family protein n=1 Tax=Arthrobacter halodurans TaxID=516699 RepID=A0ABV4UMN9_9MICC